MPNNFLMQATEELDINISNATSSCRQSDSELINPPANSRPVTRGDSPKNEDNEDSDEISSQHPDHTEGSLLADIPAVDSAGGLTISGSGEDASIKFQLIPISETPGKSAVGEVVERCLKEKDVIKIGRQVMRDGQATIKGNKKATEQDIWFTSKVVSRLHAEIWTKDGQLCIKDVGSSSGTFLNQMRLSPSGKESRPYPLKQGDVIQFGVDFKGKTEDVYRAITMKLGFHDQSWLKANRKNANGPKFSAALKQLIAATNPYGENKEVDVNESGDIDCCICIGTIAPYQALFIAPCSHCYHYKCVGFLVSQSPMFQCPLCRQVANLTASVSCDSLNVDGNGAKISIPLPILEDELPKKPEEQAPVPAKRPSATGVRRSSFSGAKKLMENLGFITSRSHPEADNQSNQPTAGPSSNASPANENPLQGGDKTIKKRSSLNFRFRFGKTSEKDKDSVPRSASPASPPAQGDLGVSPRSPDNLADPVAQIEHLIHDENE